MWPTIAFAAFLTLLSAGLLASHLAARRRYLRQELPQDEREYRRCQCRRRIQASSLIGVVGLALLGGLWVDGPPQEALYWTAVLLAVIWILVLASADISSTRSFFGDVQRQRADEHAALREELDRYLRREANGHHDHEPPL